MMPPLPPRLPTLLLRALIHLLPWLLHLSLANTLLSLLLPLALLSPTQTYNASSLIASTVWAHIQHLFTRTNGAHILVTGDPLPSGESAIVVSNHVDWTDFYLIQELALRAGMLGRCRWFAKKELKWVPFLGWGLWAMGMPLVSRKWMEDRKELNKVFRGVTESRWPIWLISFSESTRLTPQKRQQAAAHASKTNKPLPQHLLLPRTKGFAACVQHLRTAAHVKAVYDVTVAYAERSERPERPERSEDTKDTKRGENGDHSKTNNVPASEKRNGFQTSTTSKSSHSPSLWTFQRPPTFLQSIFLPNLSSKWRTLVHVRRFELSELPESEAELKLWLEKRWVEKGELLASLNQKLERGEEWEGAKEE